MIGLHINASSISITPGESATVEAVVVNNGTTVDEIAVDVVGEAAGWSTVTPPTTRLFPGDRATVQVRLHPVLGPGLASGRHDFGLRARSTTDASASVVEEGTVWLGATPMIAAQLVPRLARGRMRARQRLQLTNVGNSTAIVSVAASDPDDQLTIRHDRRPFELGAGHGRQLKLVISPASRAAVGTVPIPLTVTVTPEGGTPTCLEGRATFGPRVPEWLKKACVAVGAAAALVAAILVLRTPSAPESTAADAKVRDSEVSSSASTATTTSTGVDDSTTTPGAASDPTDSTTLPGGAATTVSPTAATNTTAAPNQVSTAGPQPWTIAAGGTDGSVWLLHSDGGVATPLVPGGSALDPRPSWSPDRSEIAFVTRQGPSTGIAFAPATTAAGPGQALPLLPCQTCDPGPIETDPKLTLPPKTVAPTLPPTTAPVKTTVAPATTSPPTSGTTVSPTATRDHPVFLTPASVAWAEQSCAGQHCTTSVVFGDTALKEQSRTTMPGSVTMMAPEPTGDGVLAIANGRLWLVRPAATPTDRGGPFSGVSVDRHGHTIGWHGPSDGQGAVLEDVQDHHTIPTGAAGAITSLTYSPDGTEVAFVRNGRVFVANADFTAEHDQTPPGLLAVSVA